MARVYGGAALTLVGIAVLIELHIHESYLYPLVRHHRVVRLEVGGWGGLGYGLAKIGAWTLVLVGALLFVSGMAAHARRRGLAVS
jgi:hypothetical protein